jgi:hypothetical protein
MNVMKRGTGDGARATGRASSPEALGHPMPRITSSPRGPLAPFPLPRVPFV